MPELFEYEFNMSAPPCGPPNLTQIHDVDLLLGAVLLVGLMLLALLGIGPLLDWLIPSDEED